VSPLISIHLVDAVNASLLDRVDDDVFDHAIRPESLHAFLANPSNILVVAVSDGEVVGMASGLTYLHPDKPLQLFINEVGVSRRFHGRGIGKQLMATLLQRGRELGCQEAWVATEENNTAARALYAAAGGREDDDRAVVYVYPLGGG
jgi:ribosomal protein S18 acetylase RimI-like enzyme